MNNNLNPNWKNTTKIPFFRRCVLQNFPFIEKDFDALTDYELISKVVEYLNKVIEQQNITSDNTNELYRVYELLKNYVENYFENLDVQKEINNKLDEMASDGTLENIISSYINPALDEINDVIATQNTRITTLEGRVSEITNLPEGSTSGDAELVDIRVGYNGTIYNTAGDAVRGQIGDIVEIMGNTFYSKKAGSSIYITCDIAGSYNSGDKIYCRAVSYTGENLDKIDLYGKKLSDNSYFKIGEITNGTDKIITIADNYTEIRFAYILTEAESGETATCQCINLSDKNLQSDLINLSEDVRNIEDILKYCNYDYVTLTNSYNNEYITKDLSGSYASGDSVVLKILEATAGVGNGVDEVQCYYQTGGNWVLVKAYKSPNVNDLFNFILPANCSTIRISVKYLSASTNKKFTFIYNVNGNTLINDLYIHQNKLNKIAPFYKDGYKLLVIGDSYSQQHKWIDGMQEILKITDIVNLGVTNASVRDKYADRTTYPYTSRPVYTDNTGNKNTFACQIQKLKRLMTGTDLDAGETQIYANEVDYPDIVIIEGGMNDNPDSSSIEETYNSQFLTLNENVYYVRAGQTQQGNYYTLADIDTINRTCFAGAYRYLVEEILTLFPNTQIFITTASRMGYFWYDVNDIRDRVANQQRKCATLCGVSIIDWNSEGYISTITDYPSGSGTENDPYKTTTGSLNTSDGMHPNTRGGKIYGRVAGNTILNKFINLDILS